MIQYPRIFTRLAMLTCLVFLSACATTSVDTLSRQTSDMMDFADDARAAARAVGTTDVLVVFDIDNTLLAMEQGLGADQWYEWQKETMAESPCDGRLVTDRLAVQGALYFASAMRPTQDNTAEIVRSLQDDGFRVIALTSRGVDFRLQTFRELRRNGIDLRRNPIGPESGWNEDFVPEHGIRPARYEDGVFLTTGQHKGKMLNDLLVKTGTPMPGVILMLDDKQSNLDAIVETFSAIDVPVRAWRYAGEDQSVADYDADLSHEQLEALLPAFISIQEVLGPDNYELPANNRATACEEPASH